MYSDKLSLQEDSLDVRQERRTAEASTSTASTRTPFALPPHPDIAAMQSKLLVAFVVSCLTLAVSAMPALVHSDRAPAPEPVEVEVARAPEPAPEPGCRLYGSPLPARHRSLPLPAPAAPSPFSPARTGALARIVSVPPLRRYHSVFRTPYTA
ncbi:hypothetical protein GGX14DRAFT_594436 [Mycena pura]|uniref:Uncharacterized protein n=1 Tax=Mycena pura TaxID=153505 RepID=A0AAD6UQU2_9AGAR|nr:hypothetical protein GGX14DRAFT_594436 [Mycena pura]